MLFSSSFDRRKVNPFIYVKFWRQACLPTLLYDAELFTLTPTSLLRLERCQSWFPKNIFYVPKFAPGPLLLALSCLNSVESEIATRKLLLSGRLINEPKMSPAVKGLFDSRTKSFFDSDITSLCVFPSIAEALHKYQLFHYFENWHNSSTFPIYSSWKKIVRDKIFDFERRAWDSFCESHPNRRVVQSCLENVSPFRLWSLSYVSRNLAVRSHLTCGPLSYSEELFVNELICTLITPWHGAHDIRWNRSQLVPIKFKSGPSYVKHTIANQFPDLVSRLHVQVSIMGNFGLNGSLPWLQNTDGAICFICKEDTESVTHFFFSTALISETILNLSGINSKSKLLGPTL